VAEYIGSVCNEWQCINYCINMIFKLIRIEISWTYPRWCVNVAVFGSRQSTSEQCNIHTPTRTLPIYAATSPL